MIAVSVSLALAAGAFHIGQLFSRYEIERGEILQRLDKIEGLIQGLSPRGLRKSNEAGKG